MTTPAKPAKAIPAWARSSPGSAPIEREALAWLRRHDQWWTVRDMYTVDVGPGHDDRFVIAVALVVDAISHAPR